jgi:predicted P-loop ATPase
MADLKNICYPAPAALVEHCKRKPRAASVPMPGFRDKGDVAELMKWLTEHDAFEAYEDWVSIGMALKLEYGDDGLALWELTFDDNKQTPALAANKWDSFSTEPDSNSVTLNTWLDRAHKLGWRGQVRKSIDSMFGAVAQIAADAGASLPSGTVPMLGGQEELARLGAPILQGFLDSSTDAPTNPTATNLPTLPASLSNHGLYDLVSKAIPRIFSLADLRPWKAERIVNACAVLHQMHPDVYAAVTRRLEDSGLKVPHGKIKQASTRLEEDVQRITVTGDKWERDPKGKIESDNPDNVRFGLEYLGCDLRWNAWAERMQVKGFNWSGWTNVDDNVVAALLTRWGQSKTRFCPGLDFTWRTLLAVSNENAQDPLLNLLGDLESKWDRTPRLVTWLSRYCGTPCDVYHQAVGKLIVGGMVLRARGAGKKFDFMPVFYGPQGTGKSTLARILALRLDWFDDTVQLGDASKELILSLAGKLVVEISEMGMRSNTNAAQVKAMISRQVDRGRTAYARTVSERHRRNIFIGTTNDDTPLSDPTGNRRFLPIRIDHEIDLRAFAQDVGQLIGEACALHTAGESFDLPRDVWSAATGYQEGARDSTPLEEVCHDWFDRDGSFYILSSDLLTAFRMSGFGMNVRPGVHLKKLGWRKAQVGARRERVWIKHRNNDVAECLKLLPAQQQAGGRVEMRIRTHAAELVR